LSHIGIGFHQAAQDSIGRLRGFFIALSTQMVDFAVLFARLGHFFYIGEGINAALRTTVPGSVDDALQGLGSSLSAEYETVRDGVLDGQDSLQQAGASANGTLVSEPSQDLLLLTVSDDQPIASTLELAVLELIKQMEDNSQSLDASTVIASVAYDATNTGNGVVLVSSKRTDGRSCYLAYGEEIDVRADSVVDGEASFSIVGEPLIDPLMPTWPGGSGADANATGKTASSTDNLAINGTFEESDDQSAHLPEGWIAPTATLGTTLKMGSVEVQTVIMSGTPTSGYYLLHWVNAAGQQQTTVPLACDAGESTVQTALQALAGLEDVTVATTGTSPNYTHTITFTGVTNPAQLTSTDNTSGGTHAIAHATSTAASANVMRGARSVEFDSDGSQLTTILRPVALTALEQYAFCAFFKTDTAPAAGVFTIDLVDGIAGNTINDQQGVANSFTVDATVLTTTFVAKTGVFRTPAIMPAQVYLRIRISTAVTNTSSVFVDEVYLGVMTEAYTDGPSLTIFNGSTDWLAGDLATITVSQDRAGMVHEWLDRILALRESRLLFPVASGGGETIYDSLVAAAPATDSLEFENGDSFIFEDGASFLLET
jgi:hypothetical protein